MSKRQFFYFKFLHRGEYGVSRMEVSGNTEGLVTVKDIEIDREYKGMLSQGPFKEVDGEVQELCIGLTDVPALIHMLQLALRTNEEAPKK